MRIAVAHLGDPPEPRLAAGRMFTRGRPKEGGELPPAGKRAEVLDLGEEARRKNFNSVRRLTERAMTTEPVASTA